MTATMNATKERGEIVGGGMGGFLNPPGHPEHTKHVETDLNRPSYDRGGMSLSAAIDCEWLSVNTRNDARLALSLWTRPAIDSPEVKEWISQVLGYFRGCYKNPEMVGPEAWNASNLQINPALDPFDFAYCHAGVNLIRRYYSEYEPTREDFAGAYWGTKPKKD
jgi:hypothetical protein